MSNKENSASKIRPPMALKRPLKEESFICANKKSRFEISPIGDPKRNTVIPLPRKKVVDVSQSGSKLIKTQPTYSNRQVNILPRVASKKTPQSSGKSESRFDFAKPLPSNDKSRLEFRKKTSSSNILRNKNNNLVTNEEQIYALPKKPKRPGWDLKGRIQDMEEEFRRKEKDNQTLQFNMEENMKRIATLEESNIHLHKNVESKSLETQEASSKIDHLEKCLRDKQSEIEDLAHKFTMQAEEFKTAKLASEMKICDLQRKGEVCAQENEGLRTTVSQLTGIETGLRNQLQITKRLLSQEEEKNEGLCRLNEKLREEVEFSNKTILSLEEKIRNDEMTRRTLHNTIQELKGNIRVFCRVRPLLQDEKQKTLTFHHIDTSDPEHRTISVQNDNCSETTFSGKTKVPKKYDFTFDRVFEPHVVQADIFSEISQLVQSALDGYNVCIFAYGQTGSGKTFTMEGPVNISSFKFEQNNPDLGIIPRTVQQVFQSTKELATKGWKYEMQVSYLEVYNEIIRDLLGDTPAKKHEIKKIKNNSSEVYVTNLNIVKVKSSEQILGLLKKAQKNRAVAATLCNEYSSRSHSVFCLQMVGENEFTRETCKGLLNLVDLAGSERIKESGSEGDRLKEAKNINTSLSDLGNVIMALAQKEQYVPYRNSKLTHLLMNSLEGKSKTLMFVNISANPDHFNETLNSLRFAQKVNQCEIGTAQRRLK